MLQSRMDKYQNNENNNDTINRSSKHSYLYEETYGNVKHNFEDLPIPTNTNEIDISKLKKVALNRDEYKKVKELDNITPVKEEVTIEEVQTRSEMRIRDINELLKKAKEENSKLKEVQKRTINSNYEFLKSLDTNRDEIVVKNDKDVEVPYKEPKIEQTREIRYHTKKVGIDLETEKALARTSTLSLDILSDLKPSGNTNTIVTPPLKEKTEEDTEPEIAKLVIDKREDKPFYSNSYTFSKKDFDVDKEKTKTNKNVMAFRIGIILITFVIIIGIVLYILNYLEVFKLF